MWESHKMNSKAWMQEDFTARLYSLFNMILLAVGFLQD